MRTAAGGGRLGRCDRLRGTMRKHKGTNIGVLCTYSREAWMIVPEGKWKMPDSSSIARDTKKTGGDKTISALENELAVA